MWSTIWRDGNDRIELLEMSGGYLLRNWAAGPHSAAPQVALVFIAGTLPPPPVVVDQPAVTVGGALVATAASGDVLTCTAGNWDGVPLMYEYTWRRDGAPIAAASVGAYGDPNTYRATESDVGATLDCVVTARNAGGATDAAPSNGVEIG